jgi:hypothetical protein
VVSDGTATVEDLKSKNGTLLKKQPVTQPTRLADLDELQIGSARNIVRVMAAGESTIALSVLSQKRRPMQHDRKAIRLIRQLVDQETLAVFRYRIRMRVERDISRSVPEELTRLAECQRGFEAHWDGHNRPITLLEKQFLRIAPPDRIRARRRDRLFLLAAGKALDPDTVVLRTF